MLAGEIRSYTLELSIMDQVINKGVPINNAKLKLPGSSII